MFTQDFYVICDNIRSTFNGGAIFRTADAAGITKLYLCGYTPTPPRYEIEKVALGAEKTIPWEHVAQTWRLLERLKAQNVQIVALENNIEFPTIDYRVFVPKFPIALVLGNEVTGLSHALLKRADAILTLPMHGQKESLNVAVAFGIAAYRLNEKRN
ncbi:MAG: TrmH family RNA methyltransferase [Candidatus Bipolaricaulota bacterium]|nr:TrmH family RNA methyltransferase [Candidatus Bipolaricaulota bacterium]